MVDERKMMFSVGLICISCSQVLAKKKKKKSYTTTYITTIYITTTTYIKLREVEFFAWWFLIVKMHHWVRKISSNFKKLSMIFEKIEDVCTVMDDNMNIDLLNSGASIINASNYFK